MYLTEIIQGADNLSILEKLRYMLEVNAEILWGDTFSWKDFLEFVAAILVVVTAFINLLKWLKNNILKFSAPYRGYKEVIDRTLGVSVRKDVARYYIPTRCQDKDPCNEEEICEFNGKYVTEKLIPFFLDAFKSDSFGQYYIILADSGMGKTTFLVRLYREYILKLHFWPERKLKVCFVPLTSWDWLHQIERVDCPEKTILLLDALDENKEAIDDCNLFLRKIADKTQKFNKVVLTCRTQFFPKQIDEPKDTGLVHAGTGKKSSEFIKKYITPFSNYEVNHYLQKRFMFNLHLQIKAKHIVKKVPAIMARPLILYWIDYLVDRKRPLKYSFEIYERIINKWIERECGGQWNDRESGRLSKRKLRRLSNKIACYMLLNEITVIPSEIVASMAREEDIDLEPIIAKSRSLLNRNSKGEYKFAHRSFLEFILAKKVFKQRMIQSKNAAFLHNMSGFRTFFLEYILNDLQITNSKEELESFFLNIIGSGKMTIDEAFGPDVMKLYSVRNYKMLDGFRCLLVKIAYCPKNGEVRNQVYFGMNRRVICPEKEYKLLVQEILLGCPKKNVANIISNRSYWVHDRFYDTEIKPYMEEMPSVRYIDWNRLPTSSGWVTHFVDESGKLRSVSSDDCYS